MTKIRAAQLPADSLLARSRGPECYRDAFCVEVPRAVSLPEFIAAFYSSAAFTPERWALHLIGRGASRADIAALADDRTRSFAAWEVEAREEHALLMRDYQDFTCSWLAVEPSPPSSSGAVGQMSSTTLWFGSGVRRPDRWQVRAMLGFHKTYAKLLLAGAARALR